MKREWLFLLNRKALTCHLCGLIIVCRKDLSGDHWPIPRSKGGNKILPAHKWCDHSHENRSYIYSSDLEKLVKTWKRHKIKFSNRVYDSIRALKEKEK